MSAHGGGESLPATLGSRISYSQVWEDEEVLRAALSPRAGARVLCIASAGDNAISLALAGAQVTALDLSLPQLALTELKLAAGALPYEQFLAFLGARPAAAADRAGAYAGIRPSLSGGARAFWDAHPEELGEGVLRIGRLERYFALFRRWILPLLHRRRTVEELFALGDLEAQRRFYDERWNTPRWRGLFRLFFSRPVIARFGRSRAQFAHVDAPVAELLLARGERAFTAFPIATNPYLEWILRGAYRDPARARRYLSPEGHRGLKAARERLRLVQSELRAHLLHTDERYDAFAYSDVPEYLSAAEHAALVEATLAAARPGARIAYWNLFVPRSLPEGLSDRLASLSGEADALFQRDRAFLYGSFQLEVVR